MIKRIAAVAVIVSLIPMPIFGQTLLQQNFDPRSYQFTRTNGSGATGNLSSAGAKTISLTPCPKGLSATHHMVYISGGSGTAEAVTLTAVTPTGSDCTIGATTANIHTGAWSVRSATAGTQEAVNAAAGPANIVFPWGIFDFYGTFWSPGNVSIRGGKIGVTTLRWNSLNSKMFDIERDYFTLSGINLLQVGTATSGSIGVFTAGNGSGITSANANQVDLTDVRMDGFYNNTYLHGSSQSVNLTRITSVGATQDCIVARGAQGYWESVIAEFCAGNGITKFPPTTPSGWSPFMSGIQTYNNGGWGIESTSEPVQISGNASFFNNDKLGSIHLAGTAFTGGWIRDAYIQAEGATVSWGASTTARGILIDAGVQQTLIDNINIFSVTGNCLEINGPNTMISHIFDVGGCGSGTVAGNIYSIRSTGNHNSLTGNYSLAPVYVSGSLTRITGNQMLGTGAVVPSLYVPSGTDVEVDQNHIFNSTGGATAFKCDSPATLVEGKNAIFGTITNTCAISTLSISLTATLQKLVTFANLGSGAAGLTYWCTDCAIGNPCAGSGTGALAISNGAAWVCK